MKMKTPYSLKLLRTELRHFKSELNLRTASVNFFKKRNAGVSYTKKGALEKGAESLLRQTEVNVKDVQAAIKKLAK